MRRDPTDRFLYGQAREGEPSANGRPCSEAVAQSGSPDDGQGLPARDRLTKAENRDPRRLDRYRSLRVVPVPL